MSASVKLCFCFGKKRCVFKFLCMVFANSPRFEKVFPLFVVGRGLVVRVHLTFPFGRAPKRCIGVYYFCQSSTFPISRCGVNIRVTFIYEKLLLYFTSDWSVCVRLFASTLPSDFSEQVLELGKDSVGRRILAFPLSGEFIRYRVPKPRRSRRLERVSSFRAGRWIVLSGSVRVYRW